MKMIFVAYFVLFQHVNDRLRHILKNIYESRNMEIYAKLKQKKILLIDDDEWIRDSLRLLFEGEGCCLEVLETAEEGLEKLKESPIDIIIVDYRLPGMDGLEFIKQAQGLHFQPLTILITAYGNDEVITEAEKLGIHDFIEKPFTSNDIELSLSRLIKQYEQGYSNNS